MLKIPLDIDASLSDTGIDLHGWVGDWDLEPIHISWSRLVSTLIEGHVIPSRPHTVIMSVEDHAHLHEVISGLRETASMLEEQLEEVTLRY